MDIVQEKSKVVDTALASIDPKLAKIKEEIENAKVPVGKVYFLDKDGNRLKEGNSEDDLKLPANTAKIIANGNLNIKGDLDNITVFAKTSVTASNTDSGSKIIAGGDVNIGGLHLGEVAAGGNFITKGIIFGEVAVKGRVFASVSQSESKIFAGKDVHITSSTQGGVFTGGNFQTESAIHGEIAAKGNVKSKDSIYGKVTAGGNITAKDTQFTAEVVAGGDVNTQQSTLGEITAGGNFSTKIAVLGKVTAGGSITAKEIDRKAKIDTPHLYIRKGGTIPKEFENKTTFILKNKWEKFTPPPFKKTPESQGLESISSENAQAINDFRRNVSADCKDMSDSSPCPPAHSQPSPAKQR